MAQESLLSGPGRNPGLFASLDAHSVTQSDWQGRQTRTKDNRYLTFDQMC